MILVIKSNRKTNKKCHVDNFLLKDEEESNDELLGSDPSITATPSKAVKKRT